MRSALQPNQDELMELSVDITEPSVGVDVLVNKVTGMLWINIDGICVLRVCRAPRIELLNSDRI